MKKDELKNVRGSIDYGGKDALIRSFISKTLQEIFENYGYTPLETSILCYYDLLALKYDENNDILKEIYKVKDQRNRKLGLRYDLTVPFAKYIASNKNIKLPYKRYEIGKVFRDGPIKKGRTREFIQCDVDCVGIEGQMIEVELISIFVEGCKKLGIDIIIKYNNRKLMNGIIEFCNINTDKISQVITIIDKIEKLTKEELNKEFDKIEIKKNQVKTLMKYFKMEYDELNKEFKNTTNINIKEGLNELNELNKYIKELNLNKYVKFSSQLARGQEYYTGTIFEVYAKDNSIKSSIGGGGRYDNMIGEFINDGKKYPAVGISFGLDVIFELLKEKETKINDRKIFIVPMNNNILALKMANELRKEKINVEIDMKNLKLKKSLSLANEKEIPVVIILGENEINKNKVIIKDMKNNFQIVEDIDNYKETINDLFSIKKIDYKILNPGGNKTALINGIEYTNNQKKLINDMIMNNYPQVEQVGFLSDKENRLEMAGGEFCINGARCAIFEYLKGKEGKIELSVSGTDKKIIGKVLKNRNVEVKLNINKKISDLIEIKNDFMCIKIDGILIAVLDEEKSKKYIQKLKENEQATKIELKQLMINDINSDEKAIGIILLEKVSQKIKMNPIVWVKEINTIFYETACGSGSIGTAIYNYLKNSQKEIKLVQPSGYSIYVRLEIKGEYIENAVIRGIVIEEEKDGSKRNIKGVN